MIKNMNSKMTTNSQLSITESKKTETDSEMEITWRVIGGEREAQNRGRGIGIKKHKW